MRSRLRVVALSLPLLLAVALVALATFAAAPAVAQSDPTPSPAEPSKPADEPDARASDDEMTRDERKRQARQERIDAYLKKRDERRAEKEQMRLEREVRRNEAEAQEIEKRQLAALEEAEREAREKAVAAAAAAADVAATTPEDVASSGKRTREKKKTRARGAETSRLPRALARAQANIRATDLGLDSTVQEYLTLIDQQGASPHELAAFGSFIAQNGMVRDALVYYGVALRLAKDDPTLWINAGTLHLQTSDLSAASAAFSRALAIDPNNAVAHYNMGAVLDEMNRYEDAVAAYKAALTLDPALGDPTQNPQAANNDLLLAVRLMLYQERTGSLAVPLLDVTTGKLPDAIDKSENP